MRRTGTVLAAALFLVFALAAASLAAPLSGGNTIYIIDGEDRSFTFDPIVLKEGVLLPEEVLLNLGVTVTADGKALTVTRGPVTAELRLGQTQAMVNGAALDLPPGPLRLVGKLFLPARLLEEFGFAVSSEGSLLQIRDLAAEVSFPDPPVSFADLWQRRTLKASVPTDDARPYIDLEVTYLTPDLIGSDLFTASFRQRVEYLSLLKTNTLLLVRAANRSSRSATLAPASLMLVDPTTGQQYDVEQALEHNGLISAKMAAGAVKSSVLVYPPLPAGLESVLLFSDTKGAVVGELHLQ